MSNFEDLLSRMDSIAEAVNKFKTEGAQIRAFEALLDAAEVTSNGSTRRTSSTATPRKRTSSREAGSSTNGASARPKRRAGQPHVDAALNFRPKGVTPFTDFLVDKAPTTNDEKCLVALYWLLHTAKQKPVGVDQVFTAFREAKWKVPPNLRNTLAVIKSKKGWMETSNMDDLQTTVIGDNYILHDLPKPAVKK